MGTREASRRNGKLIGERNRASGHIQEIQKIGCSLGGEVIAARNMESGRWESVRKLGESAGGKAACHIRWHIKRGVYRPQVCELCAQEVGGRAVDSNDSCKGK